MVHGELGACGGSQTDPGLQREVLIRRGEFKEAPIKRQLDGIELSPAVCPGEPPLLVLLEFFKINFNQIRFLFFHLVNIPRPHGCYCPLIGSIKHLIRNTGADQD